MDTKTNIEIGKPASFCDMMGLMFVGLKLAGFIGWKWIWVVMPWIFECVLAVAALSAIKIKMELSD